MARTPVATHTTASLTSPAPALDLASPTLVLSTPSLGQHLGNLHKIQAMVNGKQTTWDTLDASKCPQLPTPRAVLCPSLARVRV